MNQTAEIRFLQNLCIPTMLNVLKQAFIPDNDDILSSNPSLNLSEDQLSNFAFDILMTNLQYDIKNLAENDPAAAQTGNKVKYVWESYKGLKAIMYYRIAHQLLDFDNNCLVAQSRGAFYTEEDDKMIRDYMSVQARRISERAATETTIEINPAANIGKGFVIDHGIGTKVAPGEEKFSTVIGETCIIGENCTLLNSVLLGAAVINEASTGKEGVATGKRHPTLGNKVTVCAGVRILGDVVVGNNVTIGPCCVVTTSIPDNYYVSIINQLQYSRPDKRYDEDKHENKPIIHGLTIDEEELFQLFGERLDSCQLSIVSQENGKESDVLFLKVYKKTESDRVITFSLEKVEEEKIVYHTNYSLRIKTPFYEYILSEPHVLVKQIRKILGG